MHTRVDVHPLYTYVCMYVYNMCVLFSGGGSDVLSIVHIENEFGISVLSIYKPQNSIQEFWKRDGEKEKKVNKIYTITLYEINCQSAKTTTGFCKMGKRIFGTNF